MDCRVQPYEGNEAKVHMVFAYDDDPVACPLIERLAKCGLRVWHDAEIRKIRVDYNLNLKKEQDASNSFLVFLTEKATSSHVFRERLTNAVESGKPLVIIQAVDSALLSIGMKLQIEKAQHVIQSSYIPEEKLTEEIVNLQTMKVCMGEACTAIEVQPYPQTTKVQPIPEKPILNQDYFEESDRTTYEIGGGCTSSISTAMEHAEDSGVSGTTKAPEPSTTGADEERKEDVPKQSNTYSGSENVKTYAEPSGRRRRGARHNQQNNNEQLEMPDDNNNFKIISSETKPNKAVQSGEETLMLLTDDDPLDKTTIIHDSATIISGEDTLIVQRVKLPVICSLMSGEKQKALNGETVIGRAKKLQTSMADIAFSDECKLFSGKHFSLMFVNDGCVVRCNHPNGMNVNGQDMQEGDKYTIEEGEAMIQIPSNATLAQVKIDGVNPSFLVIASGQRANILWNLDKMALLKSEETGEIRYFSDSFQFGRDNPWKDGVLTSRSISRNHGVIRPQDGRFIYEDRSSNGTMINGSKIQNQSVELKNKDIISVVGDNQREERFLFHCCFFGER